MNLNDLKKTKQTKPPAKITADEFIQGATHYAMGESTCKSSKRQRQRHYKNATFSLSLNHIKLLAELTKVSHFNKSQIIRALIDVASQQPEIITKLEPL